MGCGRRICVGRIAGGRQENGGGSVIWTIILRPAGAQAAGDRQPVPMNSSDGRSCGEIGKEGDWKCETGSSESSERPKRTGEAEDCGWTYDFHNRSFS